MEQLQIGDIQLTWLNGGVNHLDGGAMFGVVPKPLWSKRYPCNELNQIELRTDPIFIQSEGKKILLDSGMGQGKLDEKQKRNFGVLEESHVASCLEKLGISCSEIDLVLLTHLHFDHACGLTKEEQGQYVPVFPNAKHIVSKTEWEEMQQPNLRSKNTYWKQNWQAIVDLVEPFEEEVQVTKEIKMIHTGGHSAGHSIIRYDSAGQQGIHFGDLMPTHAHQNPLWVLAYDDYPMDSVFAKEKWVQRALEGEWWVTFYHDAYYRAIKWNTEKEVLDQVKRIRPE